MIVNSSVVFNEMERFAKYHALLLKMCVKRFWSSLKRTKYQNDVRRIFFAFKRSLDSELLINGFL